MPLVRIRSEHDSAHDVRDPNQVSMADPVEDEEIVRQLSDTVWELLLDQFLAIPDLANLSLTHVRLLYWLRDCVPVTARRIGREFGPSPLITARLLNKLVRRGLVARCGDLNHRNTVFYRLSDAGIALLARMEACQRRSFRRLLRALSADELHDFADGFDLMLRYTATRPTPIEEDAAVPPRD
jgi:DNA-binding MarR family transcriptional regulator